MSKEVIEIHGNAIPTPMKIPDWNQTDETKSDYIKNKPDIPTIVEGFGIPFDESGADLLTIDKVHPKEHDVEVAIERRNLIPFPYYQMSATHNGVTFTVNDDGTVTANGTAEGGTASIIIGSFRNNPFPAGTYTMSGVPTNGTYMNFSGDVNAQLFGTVSKSLTFTITEGQSQNVLTCCVSNGTTVENVVFKPMLEKGTVATPYTPYISDMSVVNKVDVLGKNLCNHYYDDEKGDNHRAGLSKTNNDDGSFNLSGTLKNSFSYCSVMPIFIPKGTKVVASGHWETPYDNVFVGIAIYGANGLLLQTNNIANGQSKSTTLTEDAVSVGYLFRLANNSAGDTMEINNIKVQLEIGSVATDFEPFKGVTYPVADGKAIVKSVSPTMNIKANTKGVSINAKGYQDGLAVIDELKQAIISLGGNV